ncbi:MAG: TapY2 family type IVa secretion system protein [Colwellia sp.]
MNKFIKLTLSVTAILLSFNSYAAQNKDKLKEKKVDAKCYVQMIDGSHTISLWRIKEKSLYNLAQKINGKKIRVIGKKEKMKIYKAKECALETELFLDDNAKKLDENTPR